MPLSEDLNRALFMSDLNGIRDKLNEEAVRDSEMISLCNALALFGKEERDWKMRPNCAGYMIRGLAAALETREEAKLPDTPAVDNVKAARDWSAANGWKKPRKDALSNKGGEGNDKERAKEAKVGRGLTSWKYKDGKKDREACDFLMRHAGWWKGFADGSAKERGDEVASKVNSMLKEGHGHKDEPEFEGKKKWPAGTGGTEVYKVYTKMRRMVDGGYSESDVDSILEGVDEARAGWYRGEADAKRPAYLEAAKKRAEEVASRVQAARKRARGEE